jgi:integrase/recombinase XerD
MSLMGNEKLIEEFLIHLDRKSLSENTRKKYSYFLQKFSAIDLNRLTGEDIDEFFFQLKDSDYTGATKEDYWFMFKCFVQWMKPELKSAFSEYKLRVKKKRMMSKEVLTLKEIKLMIMASDYVRDKLLLALLYDSGCRPHELLNLTTDDVTLDEHGLVVNFSGKTGPRRIRLVTTLNSDEMLKQYLRFNKTKGRIFRIGVARVEDIIRKLGEKVGIEKRVYPYLIRHCRATHLANGILTEQQLRIYLGWSVNSRMPGVYVHLSGRDLNERIIELNRRYKETQFQK